MIPDEEYSERNASEEEEGLLVSMPTVLSQPSSSSLPQQSNHSSSLSVEEEESYSEWSSPLSSLTSWSNLMNDRARTSNHDGDDNGDGNDGVSSVSLHSIFSSSSSSLEEGDSRISRQSQQRQLQDTSKENQGYETVSRPKGSESPEQRRTSLSHEDHRHHHHTHHLQQHLGQRQRRRRRTSGSNQHNRRQGTIDELESKSTRKSSVATSFGGSIKDVSNACRRQPPSRILFWFMMLMNMSIVVFLFAASNVGQGETITRTTTLRLTPNSTAAAVAASATEKLQPLEQASMIENSAGATLLEAKPPVPSSNRLLRRKQRQKRRLDFFFLSLQLSLLPKPPPSSASQSPPQPLSRQVEASTGSKFLSPPATSSDPAAANVASTGDRRRIIALISMGKEAAETKIVERFVLSSILRGQWVGPIVLLTDASSTRYSKLQQYYLSKMNQAYGNAEAVTDHDTSSSPNQLFVIHPKSHHFNWNTIDDMPYKRFKTYLLEYIDMIPELKSPTVTSGTDNTGAPQRETIAARHQRSFPIVYYLDVDIVIGSPLVPMMEFMESQYRILQHDDDVAGNVGTVGSSAQSKPSEGLGRPLSSRRSEMYFFRGNYDHLKVQGGQFILVRGSNSPSPPPSSSSPSSQVCLEQWRNLMDTNVQQSKDQPFLHELYESQQHTIRKWRKKLAKEMMLEQQQATNGGGNGKNTTSGNPSLADPTTMNDISTSSSSTLDASQQMPPSSILPCQIHLMERDPHLYFPSRRTVLHHVERLQREEVQYRYAHWKWYLLHRLVGSITNPLSSLSGSIPPPPNAPTKTLYPPLIHIKNSGKVKDTIPDDIEQYFLQDVFDISLLESARLPSSSSSPNMRQFEDELLQGVGQKIHFMAG